MRSLAAVCCALAALPAACGAASPDPSELNNDGVRAAQSGDLEAGARLLREARKLDPSDDAIARNLSGVLTDWAMRLKERRDFAGMAAALEEALAVDPQNGAAMMHLGDHHFLALNRNDRALEYWRAAYRVLPSKDRDAAVARIALAERDLSQEAGFEEIRGARFTLRVPPGMAQDEAGPLLESLEAEYRRLSAFYGELPQPVSVIVYSSRGFERIAGSRDWAIGLYDGKIRLRRDEIGTAAQSVVVPHELAHAFIRQHYGDAVPVWLGEGLAQQHEPERALTEEGRRLLERIRNRNLWVPLDWIDRRFVQPADQTGVESAYLQARIVVASLLERWGPEKMRRFLSGIRDGAGAREAFETAYPGQSWSRLSAGGLL